MAHQNRAEKHYQRAIDNVASKSRAGVPETQIAADMGQTRKFVRYALCDALFLILPACQILGRESGEP